MRSFAIKHSAFFALPTRFISNNKRLLLPLIILLCLNIPTIQAQTITALSDAFFQVSVFVAATLLIYYYAIDHFPQLELRYLKTKSSLLEVFFASFLGALPGCGGAIIVVTQFTKGQSSFGSVVAVLTATMGDAAFLLLATRPKEGLILMAVGIVIGTLFGFLVNTIHKTNFVTVSQSEQHSSVCAPKVVTQISKPVWLVILVPSIVIAIAMACNVDFEQLVGMALTQFIVYFGAVMAVFIICVWALSSQGKNYQQVTCEDEKSNLSGKLTHAIQDTHFVTTWVVAAFIGCEILINNLGLDISGFFSQHAILAPLIAVIIGFIPGCGPQIIVTSLYIQGYLPFSALAANAISNDGDALFPAIAMAPKAALLATIYTALPALLVGYALYIFGA